MKKWMVKNQVVVVLIVIIVVMLILKWKYGYRGE